MKIEARNINILRAVISIAVVLTLLLPGSVAIANPKSDDMRTNTIVSILPLSQTVVRGETFMVSVYVEPGEPIIGIGFDKLLFNATLIQANSVTFEGFFDPYGTFFNDGDIDNISGEITDVYELMLGGGDVSTPGVFCNISFTAQQEFGTSELNLEGVIISNPFVEPVPITVNNGSVTIPDISSVISISPLTQTVEKGEAFDVSVYVEPGEPIKGVSFDLLSFDPNLIQADSVSAGDLFDPLIVYPGTIDNVNGEITDAYALIEGEENVTDNGSFIDIIFVAQKEFGTSDLELDGVIILNASSIPAPIIVNNGSVTIPEVDSVISILPSIQVVGKGETFDVSVYVEPGERITGITIGKLSFNATFIHANSVTLEGFFDPYNTTFSNGTINNINGEITNVYEVTSPRNNVSTEGYFCNISFTSQQVFGMSELDLEGVILSDEGGSPAPLIVNNGGVIIPEITSVISISPSTQTVGVGETFDVSVYVEPGEPMIGIKFDKLYFNQTLIQANSVTLEGFFDPYITFFNDGDIDNINGEITNVNEITIPFNPVSTPGVFCKISFTAQQEFGTSELDLEGVVIANADGICIPAIVNDGEVIIADEFTLTINIIGSGHVDLDPPIGPYLNNTPVELTAVADTGWVFDHWSGDLSGDTTPETIIMNSNKTVNATFIIDIVPPEITDVTLTISDPLDTDIGWENFSCTVTDNTDIDEVKLVLTGDTTTEYPMNKDGDDYFCNITISAADEYMYHIWANDTSRNYNTSIPQPFDLPMNEDVDVNGMCHFMDLRAVAKAYHDEGPNGWVREDVDNNGKVHFMDLRAIARHYNESWIS